MIHAEAGAARCIPILASLDLAETLRFYRTQLGFEGTAHGDYAILRRDAMEIHFWLARDRIHPEHTACYIRGGQVAALHAEYAARGVKRLSDFALRPWGMKEFHLIDPHGNLLRFGCAPQETRSDSEEETA
jgi:catechol 2,3-dioxygenase-like lactoylglutathione lyase family enzyme